MQNAHTRRSASKNSHGRTRKNASYNYYYCKIAFDANEKQEQKGPKTTGPRQEQNELAMASSQPRGLQLGSSSAPPRLLKPRLLFATDRDT
jgi:hypothetical protein